MTADEAKTGVEWPIEESNIKDVSGQTSFNRAITEIFQAIDVCIAQGLFVPTQILVFSCMDAFSWIELEHIRDAKQRFEAWIDRRILPHEEVLCSATDLYAARSGIVHRLGTRSRLLESGQARSIAFSFGAADFTALNELRDQHFGGSLPIVRLEALIDALRKGIDCFLADVEGDPELKAKMERYWEIEQPFRFPA